MMKDKQYFLHDSVSWRSFDIYYLIIK